MNDSKEIKFLAAAAWAAMLMVSDLPDILWHELSGQVPEWLFWSKVGILAAFLGLCWVWRALRPLWQYAVVLLTLFLALAASAWVGETGWWHSRFSGAQASFTVTYAGFFVRDLGVALVVIAALWLMKRRRSEFFLVKGQLDAPIEPVRWLGIGQGESWRAFGWIFTVIAGLTVLVVIALSMPLSPDVLLRAAPLLPVVLLLAAINAFTEESYYRASLLSTLHPVLGKNQTLLISAVFFGLAHYLYGSPPGVIGALMTGFLAWLLGKSMLETRGFLWPWFMHVVPDVVIFVSYALLWVQP